MNLVFIFFLSILNIALGFAVAVYFGGQYTWVRTSRFGVTLQPIPKSSDFEDFSLTRFSESPPSELDGLETRASSEASPPEASSSETQRSSEEETSLEEESSLEAEQHPSTEDVLEPAIST